MEKEEHLVCLVLAAAEREIRGIPPGKQTDLERAGPVGRESLREVLPEVLDAHGQSLGRIGHVEPTQCPPARRCLHFPQQRPVTSKGHVAVGPGMKLRRPVAVPILATA